jgi:DNA-binding CsgD family transcriptional regulator
MDTLLESDPSLRVEARFKNARLWNAIHDEMVQISGYRGVQPGTVSAFCQLHGLCREHVYRFLNLRAKPIWYRFGCRHKPRISPLAHKLADILGKPLDWLFPADMYAVTWPTLAVDIDHAKMLPLLAASPEMLALPPSQEHELAAKELRAALADQLATLTPREQQVIRQRFGFDSAERAFVDIGRELGISVERVRQIEMKALSKLRKPGRARALAPFTEAL